VILFRKFSFAGLRVLERSKSAWDGHDMIKQSGRDSDNETRTETLINPKSKGKHPKRTKANARTDAKDLQRGEEEREKRSRFGPKDYSTNKTSLDDRLGSESLASTPETEAAHHREGEEDAKGDAQSPDTLHLKTGCLVGSCPGGIIDVPPVLVERVANIGREVVGGV